MGYQALLFCPDEKLSLVVSQVFGELDFSVELVHEPFAAVKKLMVQHYDAIVVDNENEQNAALLFKSARNSGSNHSSLAIALVAGQAGIAKAYRIGANLVLTKPINVEQTKGTLRVARGLLRNTSEAAAAVEGKPAIAPLGATSNRITIAAEAESSAGQRGPSGAFNIAIENDAVDGGVTRKQVRSEEGPSLDAAAYSSDRDTMAVFPPSTGAATA